MSSCAELCRAHKQLPRYLVCSMIQRALRYLGTQVCAHLALPFAPQLSATYAIRLVDCSVPTNDGWRPHGQHEYFQTQTTTWANFRALSLVDTEKILGNPTLWGCTAVAVRSGYAESSTKRGRNRPLSSPDQTVGRVVAPSLNDCANDGGVIADDGVSKNRNGANMSTEEVGHG